MRLRTALVVALPGLCLATASCGSSSTTSADQPAGTIDAGPDVEEDAETPSNDAAAEAEPDDAAEEPESPGPLSCPPPPDCNVALPLLGSARGFTHTASTMAAALGTSRHRARDLYLLEGQQQWILGKFAYGTFDDDIQDEEVDVYLLRDCGSGTPWQSLGTVRTTKDGDHATVEGVEDTGGRVYLDLADTGQPPLGIGRHRILLVVGGDLTWADQYIEVLAPDAKIVVTDVDGTLTSSEYASVTDFLGLPEATEHPGAPDVMSAFAQRGYHVFYLTARAEWMMPKTREWLSSKLFPEGNVHTTLTALGATGNAAITYKTDELAALKAKTGITPSYAFGNKDTDVQAYVNAGIDPSHCFYFELGSDPQGGVDFSDYTALLPIAGTAPLACQ